MAENNIPNIESTIKEYLEKHKTEHHRYKSWEHCYNHFQKNVIGKKGDIKDDKKDYAALMLGFYLASWGMYRGSSKLLTDYTYTIHKGAIDILKEYKDIKACCEKNEENNKKLKENSKRLEKCCEKLKEYYEGKGVSPTDTLISKIILGTYGVLPAFDDYFCKGIKYFKENVLIETEKSTFLKGGGLAKKYENIQKALKNNPTSPNLNEFEQIAKTEGLPVAKIIDMYFWTLGNPKTKENRHKEVIKYLLSLKTSSVSEKKFEAK